VSEGDEIVAKVIGIDEERRRISLSVKAIHVDKEREELQDFLSQQGEDKFTLSDVLGNLLGRRFFLKSQSVSQMLENVGASVDWKKIEQIYEKYNYQKT